ncbi:MAG TPA: GNAT family N-acetyltransferase [Nocardioidaceae bacterium]|nr:GNAT family N-acetyltransferase [Nocardioidaceae bacterium]
MTEPDPDPARTWDGEPIASDEPVGSTTIVRRASADAGWEYLLLHRAHQGTGYDGDWAWTPPAGCRRPGEPVLDGARRELAEESGIAATPWPVDLTGRWVRWALTVSVDTPIVLVDAEHDRFEWVSPGEAAERIRPAVVAESIAKVDAIPEVDVDFRPMTHDDLPAFVEWQHAPHARRWFHAGRMDLTEALRRYGPRIDGDVPTRMWVAQVDGRDVGMVQDYRVGDHAEYAAKTGDPDAAAFDYLIGDPGLVGRGIGTRLIGQFLVDRLRPAYPEAPRFLASPDHRNRASLRLLDKLGFQQGLWIDEPATSEYDPPETEIVCTLDVAHWLG